MKIVRAALIQDSPVVFDQEKTVEKAGSLIKRAAEQGSELVVMPEGFVSGYPMGLDFGARVGMRKPKGRDDFKRYFESAIEIPGPMCEALGKITRETGVFWS